MTQGNRILLDLTSFPTKPINIFTSDSKVYQEFVTNPEKMVDAEGDFVSLSKKVFVLSNAFPGRIYNFFFSGYAPRERMFYLSEVYQVTFPDANKPGSVTNKSYSDLATIIITNLIPVTNIVTNDYYHTNYETNIIIEKVYEDILLQASVNYDLKTINIRSSYLKNPLGVSLSQVSGEKTNEVYVQPMTVGGTNSVPHFFDYTLSNATKGQGYSFVLNVKESNGKSLVSRRTDILFPEVGAPPTNVFEYPKDLAQYQPIGLLELFSVATLFRAGETKQANRLFQAIKKPENPISSYLFWKAILDYTEKGDSEAAILNFYEVIRLNVYRSEVFQAYLWLGSIFLEERLRHPSLLKLAENYLKTAYAMPGDSRFKDDVLYYLAKVYFATRQEDSQAATKLKDHLRFIKNTHLINPMSTYFDIKLKKEIEILPQLQIFESE